MANCKCMVIDVCSVVLMNTQSKANCESSEEAEELMEISCHNLSYYMARHCGFEHLFNEECIIVGSSFLPVLPLTSGSHCVSAMIEFGYLLRSTVFALSLVYKRVLLQYDV
jgi:hypothetical protein